MTYFYFCGILLVRNMWGIDMKVIILEKDGTAEVKNISCRGKDIEIASWDILNESVTSCVFNENKTLMCIYDDAFGWNIFNEEEIKKYDNNFAKTIFGMKFAPHNTVVIVGIRNDKHCDVRARDIKTIKECVNNEKHKEKSA